MRKIITRVNIIINKSQTQIDFQIHNLEILRYLIFNSNNINFKIILIVNLLKISSIKKSRLIIEDQEIIIGDGYRTSLYKALGLDLVAAGEWN